METIVTAFTTGLTTIKTDTTSIIAAIIPISMAIMGIIFVVKRGTGWFKSLAK